MLSGERDFGKTSRQGGNQATILIVRCKLDASRADPGLRYLKAKFPGCAAWQIHAQGIQDYQSKQIYLEQRQEARLKRVARARGVSEAEVIRQAIDRQVMGVAVQARGGDPTAWKSALRFMQSLAARPRKGGQGRGWKREDRAERAINTSLTMEWQGLQ